MRHFSSTPRALIAILAMAALSAGCGQMRTTSPSDTGATPMTGSSGSSGSSNMSGTSGNSGDSGRGTDHGQGATGTGTSTDHSGTRNDSRMTPGATPNSSVPTSDGSR